jgi:GNAT superfamily N-acetyltransferase
MLPLAREKAVAYWRGVAASAARGERVLLAAEDAAGSIVGTVQLILDLPENQPHRGEIAKMLVHRRARRRGVGDALLKCAEDRARRAGRTLLVLDTASGGAERLYVRHGWQRAGRYRAMHCGRTAARAPPRSISDQCPERGARLPCAVRVRQCQGVSGTLRRSSVTNVSG